MNNKEAIECLKTLFEVGEVDPFIVGRQDQEAINIAIKALENEPQKGKWIPLNTFNEYGMQAFYCSNCKHIIYCDRDCIDQYKACYCGVYMGGNESC